MFTIFHDWILFNPIFGGLNSPCLWVNPIFWWLKILISWVVLFWSLIFVTSAEAMGRGYTQANYVQGMILQPEEGKMVQSKSCWLVHMSYVSIIFFDSGIYRITHVYIYIYMLCWLYIVSCICCDAIWNCVLYRYMHKRFYIHTYVRTYIHPSNHPSNQPYIRTYIHTYLHTYMHTCIHTYIVVIVCVFKIVFVSSRYRKNHVHIYIYMYVCIIYCIYIYTSLSLRYKMIPVVLSAVGKKLGKSGYYKTGERMVAWLGGKNMGAVTQWLYPSGNLDWVSDFFFFPINPPEMENLQCWVWKLPFGWLNHVKSPIFRQMCCGFWPELPRQWQGVEDRLQGEGAEILRSLPNGNLQD